MLGPNRGSCHGPQLPGPAWPGPGIEMPFQAGLRDVDRHAVPGWAWWPGPFFIPNAAVRRSNRVHIDSLYRSLEYRYRGPIYSHRRLNTNHTISS